MNRPLILLTVVVAGIVVAAVFWPGESAPNSEQDPATTNSNNASEDDSSAADDRKFEPLPEPQRPDEVGQEILVAYYPEGRRETLTVDLIIEGTGSNQRWGFQGNYFLRGISEQQVKWEVAKNNGKRVEFKVDVPFSATMLTASERSYRLRLPENPLLRSVLREISPRAHQIVVLAERISEDTGVDDSVAKWLEEIGLKQDEIEQLKVKVEEAGQRIENVSGTAVYEDGLGFTNRVNLEGEQLDPEMADKIDLYLRQSSPVLAAYFLYPVRTPPGGEQVPTEVGDTWKVPARHVAGLFNLSLDRFVRGEVEVRRRENEGGEIVLEVLGGEAEYHRSATGQVIDARLRIESGTRITLVPLDATDAIQGYRVDTGELHIEADYIRKSTDHWLFAEKLQAKPSFRARVKAVPENRPSSED